MTRLTRAMAASAVAAMMAGPGLAAAAADTNPANPASLSGATEAPGATEIERGEYLARVGDCISCHSSEGGEPYAGGLPMHTPFGDLVTPNITPDRHTGIGDWSADDFYRALHHGVGKRGEDLYPAFPYTFFTKVTRADSDAIHAFLMSLKPVSNEVDVNQLKFPFNVRLSMIAWRELYFAPGEFQPDPKQSADWNRGAYLIEGLAHCSACHSPRNAMGAIESKSQWTGAEIDGWFALSLANDLRSGIGQWNPDAIVAFLKTGAVKGKATALGPMAQVVHNSTRHISDADLNAMAVYLKSLPPSAAPGPELSLTAVGETGMDPTARDQGAYLYIEHCAACHKARGAGVPGAFPPLNRNPVVESEDADNIVEVVLHGIPAQNNYPAMPPFAAKMGDQDIADLVNYIRTGWDNNGSADATPGMVAARR